MNVGIISFQGDVAEHAAIVESLGHRVVEIRSIADCVNVSHVIIPGGESTVIARFLEESTIGEWLVKEGGKGELAIFGTCAGAIMLAKEAIGKNAPKTLDLIDMTIERNAYGSQADSFEETITVKGIADPVRTSFIRAPRITRSGKDVQVLAQRNDEPTLVRSGKILASTFHPEVRGDASIHRYFLSL